MTPAEVRALSDAELGRRVAEALGWKVTHDAGGNPCLCGSPYAGIYLDEIPTTGDGMLAVMEAMAVRKQSITIERAGEAVKWRVWIRLRDLPTHNTHAPRAVAEAALSANP